VWKKLIQFTTRDVRYRLRAVDLGFALDALGCYLVRPGEKHHHRDAQYQHQQDGLHDPGGCTDIIQDNVCHLDQQPTGHDVADGYTEDISTLEFFE
jgi:hypothetical protein